MEKQGEGSWFCIFYSNYDLRGWPGAEQCAFQIVLCCNAQMTEPLVLRQRPNHRDDRVDIAAFGGSDLER